MWDNISDGIKRALQKGRDALDPKQSSGSPPVQPLTPAETRLLVAVENGNLEAVRGCLDEGAGANCRNDYGTTPLILAAEKNQVEIARLLIERGADTAAKDRGGRDSLIQAIRRGFTGFVEVLLHGGADPNTMERHGNNALIEAAEANKPEIARLLLDAKAQVDKLGAFGRSPLMVAASLARMEIMAMLADNGASLGVRDQGGKDLLMHAAQSGRVEAYEWVASKGIVPPTDPERGGLLKECLGEGLIKAVEAGSLVDAKGLLDRGALLEARSSGMPAVVAAACKGDLEILRLILDRGAGMEALGLGRTALMLASHHCHEKAVELLLERGADPNAAAPKDGVTALMLAASAGHAGIVALLLRRGANPDAKDAQGSAALDRAGDTPPILELLRRRAPADTMKEPPLPADAAPGAALPAVDPFTGRINGTILIIEDDSGTREGLAEVLELGGYIAHQAGTARSGIEQAEKLRPDVIITDIQLPDSSGFQICHFVRRRSDWGKRAIIILMTGRFLSHEEKKQGFELGADEYIHKPLDLGALDALLQQLLGRPRR